MYQQAGAFPHTGDYWPLHFWIKFHYRILFSYSSTDCIITLFAGDPIVSLLINICFPQFRRDIPMFISPITTVIIGHSSTDGIPTNFAGRPTVSLPINIFIYRRNVETFACSSASWPSLRWLSCRCFPSQLWFPEYQIVIEDFHFCTLFY